MGRAVIYTRVSTRAQVDGYSLEAQEQDGRRYCNGRHDVVAVESDTFSGHDTMDEREGMQRAIKRIRSGEADVLVIWRVDRANRFSIDNALLLRDVSEAGGSFESVTEGVIPNTSVGRFMLSAHSFAAENEWEGIRERTQRGLTERISKGHILTSSVPLYGYAWDGERKERYVIDPESGPVVQAIFDKAEQGWAVRRITRWLQQQGYPTPSMLLFRRGQLPAKRKLGEEWGRRMVAGILANESYTGKHAARRIENYQERVRLEDGRTKLMTRKRIRPESDARRVAITIPALVTPEQYARVQATVETRQRDITMENEPLLNRGFAVCGVCGRNMIATKHPVSKYRVYMCSRRVATQVHGTNGCTANAFAVRADEVDRDTWERVKAVIRDEPRYTRLVQSKTAKLTEAQAEAARRAEATAQELADTKAYADTVYKAMMRETNERMQARHRAELEQLDTDIAQREKRLAEARAAVADVTMQRDRHAESMGIVDEVISARRRALSLPDSVTLGDGTLVRFDKEAMQEDYERVVAVKEASEEVTLDSLDREAKRAIMRTLEVQVPMYPKAHEFSQTHEHRWDFIGALGVPACK
jgi:DNA invertase Pin-like site-specific DNA recombinase